MPDKEYYIAVAKCLDDEHVEWQPTRGGWVAVKDGDGIEWWGIEEGGDELGCIRLKSNGVLRE